MDSLLQDIRYAVRTLRRAPAFAVAAVATLALGIGATTTIFSLANSLLLRPYPFADEEALVAVTEDDVSSSRREVPSSYPTYLDWRAQSTHLTSLLAYHQTTLTVGAGEVVERLPGAAVSANAFGTLGTMPALGRLFSEADDRSGAAPVVLLSHRLWQERFGGARDVLGRSVSIDGIAHTVVGIMPPRFAYPRIAQLWVPLGPRADQNRGAHYLNVLGRLKPGSTIEQANAELRAITARLAAEYESNRDFVARAEPLRAAITREVRATMLLLLGAVMFVLLIACANVANLLLARAAARSREIAVRGALGASRQRILRQVLTESLVVALAGGVSGVLLSMWWLDLLLGAIPVELPYWIEFGIDWRVLAFVAATVCGSSILFGLAPALQLVRVDQQRALKDGGRGTAGAARSRLRSAFVVAQFAGSFVLLVGGGLMIRSLLAMRAVDPGFDTSGVLTMRVALPEGRYEQAATLNAFHDAMLTRLRARPEIAVAELVDHFPIAGANITSNFSIAGVGEIAGVDVHRHHATPGYFAALGIPVLSGRAFESSDALGAEPVAIINATLARRYFADADPIGKGIRFGGGAGGEYYRIVGVVGDVNQRDLNQPRIEPSLYRPFAQSPAREATLVVRPRADIAAATTAVREAVRALDRDVPVYEVRTVEQVLQEAVWDSRLFTTLFAVFAAAALLLASVGLYGVIAYGVSQRAHELGVRMALGASARDVIRLVLAQGLTLTLIGAGLGAALALAVARLMASLLYGVAPLDPITFTLVPLLLTVVALLATVLPARRATRINALNALRCP